MAFTLIVQHKRDGDAEKKTSRKKGSFSKQRNNKNLYCAK